MFHYTVLFILLVVGGTDCNQTSFCNQKETSTSYLNIAAEMITKAKYSIPECNDCNQISTRNTVDCADILQMGHNKSGVYKIWPMSRLAEDKSIDVYCDMGTSGGGWTLIQRRGDFDGPKDYFYKDWKSYKEGFGDVAKDFWLGNDNIFALTNQKLYSARFDLQDVEQNKRYAQYSTFWIDDEYHKYTLHISDFRGDAGDSMISHHQNIKFSTKDQDNDNLTAEHCAEKYKGGWWYNGCHYSNLNGLYLKGKHESNADGVNWHSWKGYHDSMERTEIKIRPKNYRQTYASTMTPMT